MSEQNYFNKLLTIDYKGLDIVNPLDLHDPFGFALPKLQEACDGIGNRGKRKSELRRALASNDYKCAAKIANSIFNSAQKNATDPSRRDSIQRFSIEVAAADLAYQIDNRYKQELYLMRDEEKLIAFVKYFSDNFFLYQKSEWEEAAAVAGVDFERVRRLAKLPVEFAASRDERGQMSIDF